MKLSKLLCAAALLAAMAVSPRLVAGEMFVNPGLSGSWYQPLHDGQGFFVEVVPTTRQLVVYWFTYAQDGSQQWLVGQGEVVGDGAELQFIRAEDGMLGMAMPPLVTPWGTGLISFDSCTEARIEYTSNDSLEVGQIELVRLTPDLSCRALQAQGPSQYVLGASGSALALNGLWSFSRCVPIGTTEGTSFEVFEFADTQVTLLLDRHQTADCSDQPFRVNIALELELAGTANATLAGETVKVTRFILTDQNTGEVVKQVFYFDDRQTPTRLHHGVFADDGGPVDAEGYPLILHEAFLERQQ